MGNKRMNPPITKTFYNLNNTNQKKGNVMDGIDCQQGIPSQMTMPNHLQPSIQGTNQIRNLRNTINNKTNIQS